MTDEEILYQHYLKRTTSSRDMATDLLKQRNFNELYRKYIHWFDKTRKVVRLKSSGIKDVISELSAIKYQDNESEPVLSCNVENIEGIEESHIEVCSFIYTIVPYEKCESLAKHYAKDSLWKLKHQPNGKDAEACRRILAINTK